MKIKIYVNFFSSSGTGVERVKIHICRVITIESCSAVVNRSLLLSSKIPVTRSRADIFCKKGVPKNFAKFTGKHLSKNLFFNKVELEPTTLLKKRGSKQVFSCELCEIFKKSFLLRTPLDDCF